MSLAIVLLWLAFFTERTCSLSASLAFSFPRRRHGPHGHTLCSIFHPHAAVPPSQNTFSPRAAAVESPGGRPVSVYQRRRSLPCTLPACDDDGMTPPSTKEARSSLPVTRTLCMHGSPPPVRGRCVAAPLRPLARLSRSSHGRSECGWPRRRHAGFGGQWRCKIGEGRGTVGVRRWRARPSSAILESRKTKRVQELLELLPWAPVGPGADLQLHLLPTTSSHPPLEVRIRTTTINRK
jgi:hypothetical protein